MKSGSILIVDDHEVVSGGVRHYLGSLFPGVSFEVAGDCKTAREQVQAKSFDLHIFDLSLPDGSGIDLLCDLKSAKAHGPVILFTGSATALEIQQGQQAGADAILSKADDIELLARAVEAVMAGGGYLSPTVSAALGEAQGVALTPRMMDVLKLLAEGLGNKEIAHRLSMAEPTVSFHLKGLRERLGAISNRETIKRAKDLGFLK